MAPRKDKTEEPVPAPAAAPPKSVSIQEFITTRDQVVNGLSSLQVAIASLLNAYLEHCKVVAGDAYPSPPTLDLNMFGNALPQAAVDTAGFTKTGKVKKAKKIRDPDAPKRPLTAAFLFSMKARPIVKGDLEKNVAPGEKLGPNAVNEEVTRRWNELPEEQKEMWRIEYRKNLVVYKEDMERYAATKKAAGEEAEAEAEAEDDVIAGAVDADSDAEGDEDDVPEPTPVVPTSAKAGAKRRKTGKENGSAVPVPTVTEVPRPSTTIVPPPGAAETPADKKKGSKKAAAPKADSPVATKSRAKKGKADEEPETPAEKKGGKRKRKTAEA